MEKPTRLRSNRTVLKKNNIGSTICCSDTYQDFTMIQSFQNIGRKTSSFRFMSLILIYKQHRTVARY
jgi:hypothetical protein